MRSFPGALRKEGNKGRDRGAQVRSRAEAAARRPDGDRRLPAGWDRGQAAAPAAELRWSHRRGRGGEVPGRHPAPPGLAAATKDLGLPTWSRGDRAFGVSQEPPWSAEADPGQWRGPRPRSLAVLLLVTITSWFIRSPACLTPHLPAGTKGVRSWKQPRPPRPGPDPHRPASGPGKRQRRDEVTARTRPPAGAAQGASGPLGPAPAGTGNAFVTPGEQTFLFLNLGAPGVGGERSLSFPTGWD